MNPNKLEGKVIAVIGASSGIGAGIIRAVADYSPKGLVLAARSVDKLEALAGEMKERGLSTLVVPTDVTKPDSIQNLIDQTMSEYGALDVLVNSAGVIQGETPHHKLTDKQIDGIVMTNYLQVLKSAPAIAQHMKAQGSGIYIVLSSHAASKHFADQAPYNSSKAAASSIALTMDNEFAPLRESGSSLWSFALEPGFINTPEARARFRDKQYLELLDKSPSPEEFGKMVTEFMISPQTKYEQSGSRHIIETV